MSKAKPIIWNERFRFYNDGRRWIIVESVPSIDKDGNAKMRDLQTYHGRIDSVAKYITDKCVGECEDMHEIRMLLRTSSENLAEHMSSLVARNRAAEED